MPVQELKDLKQFNKILLKEAQIFYLPEWKNLKTVEMYDAEKRIEYEQLSIFKPFLKLIDYSTICFYQNNYICSHFSMVPIIEGLLRKWHIENKNGDEFNEFKFIKNITNSIKQKYKKDKDNVNYNRVCLHCDLLKDITTNIYFTSCKQNNVSFNRHLVAHLLDDPNYFESRKNTFRLFCLIDLIAQCYVYDNPIKSKSVYVKTSYGGKYCYKYEIDNRARQEAFKQFYIKCLNSKEHIIALSDIFFQLPSS
ncbi:MAG: hypothetical protein V2B14_02410 [bacterium]